MTLDNWAEDKQKTTHYVRKMLNDQLETKTEKLAQTMQYVRNLSCHRYNNTYYNRDVKASNDRLMIHNSLEAKSRFY